MMFIMILGPNRCKKVNRVPRELVSAMIRTCFRRRVCGEDHAFPQTHSRTHDGNHEGANAKEHAFDWVIVDATPAVGDVEFVVAGMEGFYDCCEQGLLLGENGGRRREFGREVTVKPFVAVFSAVDEEDPGVCQP